MFGASVVCDEAANEADASASTAAGAGIDQLGNTTGELNKLFGVKNPCVLSETIPTKSAEVLNEV